MKTVAGLTLPSMSRGRFRCTDAAKDDASHTPITALTDERLFAETGVRVAFTERTGGFSTGAYGSLNLGTHVDDDAQAVARNRAKLMAAFGVPTASLLTCNQVHGDTVVTIDDGDAVSIDRAREAAQKGADALVIAPANVAALLCYADCTPVIIVAPSGAFAVAHAGWRGVVAHVAVRALDELSRASGAPSDACNVYIGPHIHAECFEVSAEIARQFADLFGEGCTPDDRHVDMAAALRSDLTAHGVAFERIVDAGACTKCENDRFYSYRAQGGRCGRHGAFAVRRIEEKRKEAKLSWR
jgi:YfiH family protein